MARFYQIARLTAGRTIFPDADSLLIDLDGVEADELIENDMAFRAAVAPDVWFWLSGGGTLLLNDRYLPIVRRSLQARVNPGKFSLFTGRADNDAERVDPAGVMRELFEELVLYEQGALLMPRLAGSQPLIDSAYAAMRDAGIIADSPVRDFPLRPVALPTRPVAIRRHGSLRKHQITWTAGVNNDINVLFLFAAECDVERLTARDGEFQIENQAARPAGRSVYLLDVQDGQARLLSEVGPVFTLRREDASPSLQFLLDHYLAKPAS